MNQLEMVEAAQNIIGDAFWVYNDLVNNDSDRVLSAEAARYHLERQIPFTSLFGVPGTENWGQWFTNITKMLNYPERLDQELLHAFWHEGELLVVYAANCTECWNIDCPAWPSTHL